MISTCIVWVKSWLLLSLLEYIYIYWSCICSIFPLVSLREGDSIDVMDCPDIADCHCDVPRQNTHTEKDKEEDVQAAACGWQSLKNWLCCCCFFLNDVPMLFGDVLLHDPGRVMRIRCISKTCQNGLDVSWRPDKTRRLGVPKERGHALFVDGRTGRMPFWFLNSRMVVPCFCWCSSKRHSPAGWLAWLRGAVRSFVGPGLGTWLGYLVVIPC